MKIAFLTIATNKYAQYCVNLLSSMEKFAFSDTDDDVSLIALSNVDIQIKKKHRIKFITSNLTHVPFPLISLLRYHYYSNISSLLKEYDYIFHIDCDMEMNEIVSKEIIHDRVCVRHPGVNKFKVSNVDFPYDRTPSSNAFIPIGLGEDYYQNCLQGANCDEFLKMCNILKNKIETDLRKNYIALWHDESYMNRYMLDNPPSLVLSSEYAYFHLYDCGPKKKIIHLDKNHLEMRKTD